jgi:hypothetical protein
MGGDPQAIEEVGDDDFLRSIGANPDLPGDPVPEGAAPAQSDDDFLRSIGANPDLPGFGDKTPANGQGASQEPEPPPPDTRDSFQRFADWQRDTASSNEALALGKGLGFGQLHHAGEWVGNKLADYRDWGHDVPYPEDTVKVGKQASESIPVTPSTMLAQGAGAATMGAAATTLAGPGIGRQALAGGLMGLARGADEGGVKGALASGVTGALTGGVGGLAAKYLPGLAGQADSLVPSWAKMGAMAAAPVKAGAGLAAQALLKRFPEQSAQAIRGAGGAAAALGSKGVGMATDMLSGLGEQPKAKAQEKAYAGTPTTSWAVESVLSSGQHGLPEDAAQELTEAVMSGDSAKLISTNFRLGQRYPAYGKRMQDTYKSLQEQEP